MGMKPRASAGAGVTIPAPGRHTEWIVLAKGSALSISFYDERKSELAFYTGEPGGPWKVRASKSPWNKARPARIRFRDSRVKEGASILAQGMGTLIQEQRPEFVPPWSDKRPTVRSRRPSKTTVAELVKSFRELESKLRKLGCGEAVAEFSQSLPSDHKQAPSDILQLAPPAYEEFVRAVGYRNMRLNPRGAPQIWLDPPWIRYMSRAIGDPAHLYDELRTLRNRGKYSYKYVVFAASDIGEQDGFCFGPSEKDGATVVMRLDRSLPDSELGLFEDWLRKQLSAYHKRVSALSKDDIAALGGRQSNRG